MSAAKVCLESPAWSVETISEMRIKIRTEMLNSRIIYLLFAIPVFMGLILFIPFLFTIDIDVDIEDAAIASTIYFACIMLVFSAWVVALLNDLDPVTDTRTLDAVLSAITKHPVLARHSTQITAMGRSITNMEARAYVDYANNHAKQTGIINDSVTYVDPKGKSGLRGRHNNWHISSDSTAPVPHGRTEYSCGDNSSSCGGGHDGGGSGSSCGGGSDGGGC